MRRAISAGWVLSTVLALSAVVWAQANINESLETARIYVDGQRGSDSNPGTQQLPLKTIGAAAALAVTNNHAGIGTKVIINPGTYRESVALQFSPGDTTMPITFQAALPGTAILSGADVWTGWQPITSNVYSKAWPYQWGLCPLDTGKANIKRNGFEPQDGVAPPEEDVVRRREMIFVNGALMTQVMTPTAMRVGTFYVSESKGKIYLWPPAGTNMNTARVEVSTRANLFSLTYKSYFVFRGLTFTQANSCRTDSTVPIQYGVSNILFDNDFFYWNNANGVTIGFASNTTVQNSVADYNGASGMKGYQTKNDLWQNNETSYNGWRGAQGVYYAWGQAGTHFGLAHNQTLEGIRSNFNLTHGFHWDTDNENDTADALAAVGNLLTGGFVEKSQGPMTLTNSAFCSGLGPNNAGYELRNSTNIALSGSMVFNNLVNWLVEGQAGGLQITNWETGQVYNLITQNASFHNNVIASGTSQMLYQNGYLGGSDWLKFQRTLASDYNTWWNDANSKPMYLPTPKNWTKTNYSGWRSATGQDQHSSWTQPGGPSGPCSVQPQGSDFWFVLNMFNGFLNVKRGSSVTFSPSIISLGFSGTVSLSSDGVQNIAGASGQWDTKTITNEGTANYTITTSASTPPGSYPITLLATSGSVTKSMTVTVTVQ